jgi:hypothetical protein
MFAQKGPIPVTSHGRITGYFAPPDEYEEFERFLARRRAFATLDLPAEKVRVIAATRMDPFHDPLDAMLDSEERNG